MDEDTQFLISCWIATIIIGIIIYGVYRNVVYQDMSIIIGLLAVLTLIAIGGLIIFCLICLGMLVHETIKKIKSVR